VTIVTSAKMSIVYLMGFLDQTYHMTGYDFCQVRDPSDGAQCCTGLDGDPDELNKCKTGI